MVSTAITLQYGKSFLFAVPGVHFNDLFAGEVNRLCADPHTRPEAIAVELYPSIAAAALEWLKELAVDGGKKLPMMLGLIGANRFIRSSLKEKARRLQVEMGMDLSEISLEVLHRELGFKSHELFCLSPSDSIVEALRCAIELDVPIYGVDLQSSAGNYGRAAVIRDPYDSQDVVDFALGNAALADQLRDEEVDSRRELAMAARLKTVLQKHGKVLFTGGLAHWLRIAELLGDESLRPARVSNVGEMAGSGFVRVVIHPALALRCIDPFPGIPVRYEETRVPVHLTLSKREHVKRMGNRNHAKIFHEYMDRAYRRYFYKETRTGEDQERHKDLESLPAFEAYLHNLCLLGHRRTPHLYTILGSAREIMSPSLVRTMAETFMDVPWAKPDDFPECSILLPSQEGVTEDCMKLIRKGGKKESIYPRFLHGSGRKGNTEVPCTWDEHQIASEIHDLRAYLYTWPPWDHLVTSLCLRAVTLGKQRRKWLRTQVFDGSLLEGIDMKATVRAFSRGQERYYVRDLSWNNDSLPNALEGFPVVWIIHDEPWVSGDWHLLYYLYECYEPYIRNKKALARVTEQDGPNMGAIMSYGTRSSLVSKSSNGKAITADQHCGFAVFQPACWTNCQVAHWAERTQYRRNPFYKGDGSISRVIGDWVLRAHPASQKRHRNKHWSTTMILAVIPYAERLITVVAPTGYVIDESVLEQARLRDISVCKVPIDSFTRHEIKQLSHGYLIPGTAQVSEGRYSKWVEEAIGQSQTNNLDLVPGWVLDYGQKRL